MAIPFTVLNAFQGVVIFLLTVVKDDFIKKEIRKKLGLKVREVYTDHKSRLRKNSVWSQGDASAQFQPLLNSGNRSIGTALQHKGAWSYARQLLISVIGS